MEMYLNEKGGRFDSISAGAVSASSEEMFVSDDRSELSPSQMVERRLMSLQNASLPVSRFELSTRRRAVA